MVFAALKMLQIFSAFRTYPLAIRITKDRKSSFIHLGKSLSKKYGEEEQQRVRKSCPNSKRLNNFLLKKVSEANEKLLELETAKSDVSPRTIRNLIMPMVGTTFIPQAQFYLDGLKAAGKFNRHSADKPRINRFKEFLKGDDISFQDISVTLLNRFSAYLKDTLKIYDR
jgi:integrase/recombinase XerD